MLFQLNTSYTSLPAQYTKCQQKSLFTRLQVHAYNKLYIFQFLLASNYEFQFKWHKTRVRSNANGEKIISLYLIVDGANIRFLLDFNKTQADLEL